MTWNLIVSALAPNSTLLGASAEERALVSQWISFADSEIALQVGIINQLIRGILTPYNKPVRFMHPLQGLMSNSPPQIHTAMTERAVRSLKTLEKHLSTRTYLVTERITLADISLASVIQQAVTIIIDAPLRAELPNTIRHLETIVNHPAMKDVFGPLQYVEKALQYVPPPKEKKEAKPAPPPAPKAEKKPKKEEEDDEDDDLVPKEEPKAKNPLDLLPKSTFNLEDWKRAYSNKDTRGADGSLEWFYQKCVVQSSEHRVTDLN